MTPPLPSQPREWVFITTSPTHRHPDKSQRSRARRRVMREIGYARRKAHAQAVPGEEYETQLITRGAIQMSSALAAPVVSPAPALSSLALDRESRWLLHHMFSDTNSNQSRIYRDRWYPICLTNAAAFNQMLATYATHVAQGRVEYELKPFILSSHTKALSGVRLSLGSSSMFDKHMLNGAVSAIAALACYSHLEGDALSWKLHITAVARLVEESGLAVKELDQKVLGLVEWVESIGSYAFDARPELRDLKAREPYHISPPDSTSPCFSGIDLPLSLLSAFRALQETNKQLSMRQASFGEAIWQCPIEIDQLIHPLTYRFLMLDPSPSDAAPFYTCIRSAALLYLAEFRRRSGISPVVTRIHLQRLRASMEALGPSAVKMPLALWLFTLGAMEAISQLDQQYFYSQLLGLLQVSGINSVPLWTQHLTEVVWFGVLFHDKLEMIWHTLYPATPSLPTERPNDR